MIIKKKIKINNTHNKKILTDFRRHKYISIAANSFIMDNTDLDAFAEDP